jgi:alpha-L-fucosidase
LDDDPGTRWATDVGTHEAWLQVDLGSPRVISSAFISESCGQRVEEFELQRQVDGRWETFHRGTHLGDNAELQFAPITAQTVRLNILKATEGPTLWEFQLFAPTETKPMP